MTLDLPPAYISCMLFSCKQSRPVWGTPAVARPIRLSTSRTGLSPVIAAEQFLPPGKLETVSLVDTTFGPIGLRPTRSRVRPPERLVLLFGY